MKKITIGLLLLTLTFLTGCSTKDINTMYFHDLDTIISDCGDTCTSDATQFEDAYNIFQAKLDSLYDELIGEDPEEAINFSTDNFYDRDILISDDAYTYSDIPISNAYGSFELQIMLMRSLISSCSRNASCEGVYTYSDVSDFNYGFSDLGGFFSYKLNKHTIYMNRFNINNDALEYEFITYWTETGGILYTLFKDNMVIQYMFSKDKDNYFMKYVNTETYDYLYTGISYRKEYVHLYDPETGLLYDKVSDDEYGISVYDDMKFVTSISVDDDTYFHKISFRYMDGWDEIYYGTNGISLFFNEEEVFENYSILRYKMNDWNLDLHTNLSMSKREYSTYQFPEELLTDFTKDDLEHELIKLENKDFLYNEAGLTQKAILDFFETFRNDMDDLIY